jgi:predicted RNA-binding Zn-ribbon protein involved in translation (DUF1610 family)
LRRPVLGVCPGDAGQRRAGRFLAGRWAASAAPAKDGKPYEGNWHCKAEFFAQGLGWVGVDMSSGVDTGGGNPLGAFANEMGDFVVFDLDIERFVEVWPGEPPASIGWAQWLWMWPRPDPGRALHYDDDHWTVDTLDLHPSRTPYRPGWKKPPPSRPRFLPGQPAPATPAAVAILAKAPAGDADTKTAAASTGSDSKEIPKQVGYAWLLFLTPLAFVLLLFLRSWWLSKRGGVPPVQRPSNGTKQRCLKCGAVVKVLAAKVGAKFQCPGCGTVQRTSRVAT